MLRTSVVCFLIVASAVGSRAATREGISMQRDDNPGSRRHLGKLRKGSAQTKESFSNNEHNEREGRLATELMFTARALQRLSPYLDWEKLHDEYLMALLTEYTPSNHRRLKHRAPRPRHGQGQKNLNIVQMEKNLEIEAMQAIAEARGYGAARDSQSELTPSPTTIVTTVNETTGNSKDMINSTSRQGDDAAFNGKPIPVYTPSSGNCPGPGNVAATPIPCAPTNLNNICSKYDDAGSFKACFEACKPSFCCIHDAPPESNQVAPNCNQDANCAQYGICYIVWWKLHDTVGPATQLRLEQNDDFFDVNASEIAEDQSNSIFYQEMLFHHFDNTSEIIRLGTVQVNSTLAVFSTDEIFLNESFWNTTI